jgi:hypothetical protein
MAPGLQHAEGPNQAGDVALRALRSPLLPGMGRISGEPQRLLIMPAGPSRLPD